MNRIAPVAPPARPLYSPLLEAAARLAARGHYHHFRKPAEAPRQLDPDLPLPAELVPYVTHLMGTACILARLGLRDEVVAAAMLHDYLEDVPDPDAETTLRREVGADVAALVRAVTEDKRRERAAVETWEERKLEQLGHLEAIDAEAVLIKLADLLHNVTSLLADLDGADNPDAVWDRFNAAPQRQLWYFRQVRDLGRRRLQSHPLVDELARAITDLERILS